jgi:prepilin-type N-terminal cleavage/methylation domain-containing protein
MKIHIIKNNKGFTLTELLVVMGIIAILGSVAITGYIGATLKAARSEAYANLEGLKVLQSQLVSETAVYAASLGVCAPDSFGNTAAIQTQLPGFQPGTGLNFSYCIEMNIDINGNAQTPCFRARAFGNTNMRAAGDVFMIDCNNNTNF